MKGTIKYSQEFPSLLGASNKWIGIDLVVNDNEDWDEKWEEAKAKVHNWGTNSQMDNFGFDSNANIQRFGAYPPLPIPTIDPNKKDTLEKINDATSQHELDLLMGDAAKYGLASELNAKKKQLNLK